MFTGQVVLAVNEVNLISKIAPQYFAFLTFIFYNHIESWRFLEFDSTIIRLCIQPLYFVSH